MTSRWAVCASKSSAPLCCTKLRLLFHRSTTCKLAVLEMCKTLWRCRDYGYTTALHGTARGAPCQHVSRCIAIALTHQPSHVNPTGRMRLLAQAQDRLHPQGAGAHLRWTKRQNINQPCKEFKKAVILHTHPADSRLRTAGSLEMPN